MQEYFRRFPDAPKRSEATQHRKQVAATKANQDPERRRIHSERMRGSGNPFHGRKHTEQTRRSMSTSHKRNHETGVESSKGKRPPPLPKTQDKLRNGSKKTRDRQRSILAFGEGCMIPGCGFTFCFHNHHIFGRDRDKVSEMILLCPNHHAMADLGAIPNSELEHIVAQRLK